MTLGYFAGRKLTGTNADRMGGTWTNLPAGWTFQESDTGQSFYWTGSAWVGVIGTSLYKYVIYRIGSIMYVRNTLTGLIESTGATTTPETQFQYALNQGPRCSIYVCAGSYTFSAGFTGLTISNQETTMVMDAGVILTVPSGYTGSVFIVAGAASACRVSGGRIAEASTTQRLWTAIDLHNTTNSVGTVSTVFSDMYIRFAGTVIKLFVSGTSNWVNGNIFENIYADQFVKGIEFVDGGGANTGINRNHFSKLVFQSLGGTTTYGVKDIQGVSNYFNDVKVWDITGAGISANILSTASDTIIVGGIMTSLNFSDLGTRTQIIEYNTRSLKGFTLNTPTIKYTDLTKASADSPYTIAATDDVIRADASSGALTVTLPTAVGIAGKKYTIKRIDNLASSVLVTIATTSSQTIDGATNQYLWNAESIQVISDGANWVVVQRNDPSPSPMYYMFRGSRRYCAGNNGLYMTLATSTTSPAINTLWALPFIVPKTTKFDVITFNVTTLASPSNARAGIYRDTGNCYPGPLIFDTGSISCATTGAKDTTITAGLQILPTGLYWLTWECDTASPLQINCLGGQTGSMIGIQGYSSNNAVSRYGYSVAHTFGALPDPYTAGASTLTTAASATNPVPAIMLQPV